MSEQYICMFCQRCFSRGCAKAVHERTCKCNPNPRPLENHRGGCDGVKKLSARRSEPWKCNWCGLEFGTRRERQAHSRTEHPDTYRCAWNKGLTAATDVRDASYAETLSSRYANGEIIAWNIGTHHDDATKKRISDSTIKYIHNAGPCAGPRYNVEACKYFDELNTHRGWNLQHALNGGEYRVGRYSLDAYDSGRNIVVEYDEHRHHYVHGNRTAADINRIKEIVRILSCTMYIYDVHTAQLKLVSESGELIEDVASILQ